jgi:hypothetical protein
MSWVSMSIGPLDRNRDGFEGALVRKSGYHDQILATRCI